MVFEEEGGVGGFIPERSSFQKFRIVGGLDWWKLGI